MFFLRFLLLFFLSSPVLAEGIQINSLLKNFKISSENPDYYKSQNYRAQAIVLSGEYIASRIQQQGHEALGLDSRHYGFRLAYYMFSTVINSQFQGANSTFFGHEASHFQMWDYYGKSKHSFYDFNGNRPVPAPRVWYNILTHTDPRSTAFSEGFLDTKRDLSKQIMIVTSGNNWQTNYSEEYVRRNLIAGGLSTFTSPAYLINRFKTLGYTIADARSSNRHGVPGDMERIEDYYVNILGEENGTLPYIALYSGISVIASATTWQTAISGSNYVMNGKTSLKDPFVFNLGPIKATWDVPNYLNAEGMSLVPTGYVELTKGFIAGFGVEKAVIGDFDNEYHTHILLNLGDFKASGDFSFSKSGGSHSEIDISYDLSEKFSLTAAQIFTKGSTLRGLRNNPYGENITYFGMEVRF